MFGWFGLSRLENGSLRVVKGLLVYSFFFIFVVLFFGLVLVDGFRTQPYRLEAIIFFAPVVFYLAPRLAMGLWSSAGRLYRFCIGLYLSRQFKRQQAIELQMKRYTPLDTPKHEIRLIAIMPGSASDPIECVLKPISLEDRAQFISFEALSYTWGSPFRYKTILLDGEPCEVRVNLYSALTFLRLQDKTRFIWIDALCINQFDMMERSQQVSIMRNIYQNSSETLVWLGDADKTSRSAFEFFELAEQENMDSFIKFSIGDDKYQSAWQAIRVLFKRDYWKRVWIIQEIATAPSLTIQCGADNVSWHTLAMCDKIWQETAPSSIAKFPKWFQAVDKEEKGPLLVLSGSQGPSSLNTIRRNFQGYFRSQSDLVEFENESSSSPRNTMVELLQLSSLSNATDPKDYIYALVGLASDCQSPAFIINYELDADKVHQSLVDYFKSKTGRIDLLGYCGENGQNWTGVNASWLPKMRGTAAHSKLQLSRISLGDRFDADLSSIYASIEVKPGGNLSKKRILVAGCKAGTPWKLGPSLKNQSSSYFTEKDLKQVTKDIRGAFNFAKSMLVEAEKQDPPQSALCSRIRSNLQSFWRVLVCDRTIAGFKAPDDWEDKFIAIIDDAKFDDYDEFTRPYQYAVLYYMYNRQLFITEEGDFGVGPMRLSTLHEKDKDDIIILLGCSVPLARKKYWYDSSYKQKGRYVRRPDEDHLLGWVYLQNYMAGQAMEKVTAGTTQIEIFSLV